MQLSQRRRTLKRTGSTAKASKCFRSVTSSSPEPPKETELCTLLYKPAKTCALFADSLAVPLSYQCSTRSKASVRKLCLLPTVLNDIRLSSRSCFRSFERKILRRERLLLVLAAESTSSNNSVNETGPDIDAWDCTHGLQPPAFRARWSSNLPHHSKSLPSSTFPFFSPPFSLALRWSATNGTLRRLAWLRAADLH